METRAEKIARLQREIAEREIELQCLIFCQPVIGRFAWSSLDGLFGLPVPIKSTGAPS